MIVVSDTSPVRALVQLGLLDQLPALFHSVVVPPAVAAELEVRVPGLPGVDLASTCLRVEEPTPSALLTRLLRDLGRGEAEAIALAVERGAEYVLVDDADGREEAIRSGVKPMGAPGVLVRLKDTGKVARIEPLITRLETELTFRVSSSLRRDILELAGEGE